MTTEIESVPARKMQPVAPSLSPLASPKAGSVSTSPTTNGHSQLKSESGYPLHGRHTKTAVHATVESNGHVDNDSDSEAEAVKQDAIKTESDLASHRPRSARVVKTSRPSKPATTLFDIQNHWEAAFVIAFLFKFREVMWSQDPDKGDISPVEFEEAFMETEPNELLARLIIRLIKGLGVKSSGINALTLSRPIYNRINAKLLTGEFHCSTNPIPEGGSYWDLDPLDKLHILRWLCEWQLSDNERIKKRIDIDYKVTHVNELSFVLFGGHDNQKNRYIHVSTYPRIYRESPDCKKWEVVSSTMDEFKDLIEKLKTMVGEEPLIPTPPKKGGKGKKPPKKKESDVEALVKYFELEMLPHLEELDKHRLKLSRAAIKFHKSFLPPSILESNSGRRTRRPVRYNFDEFDSPSAGSEKRSRSVDTSNDVFSADDSVSIPIPQHSRATRARKGVDGEPVWYPLPERGANILFRPRTSRARSRDGGEGSVGDSGSPSTQLRTRDDNGYPGNFPAIIHDDEQDEDFEMDGGPGEEEEEIESSETSSIARKTAPISSETDTDSNDDDDDDSRPHGRNSRHAKRSRDGSNDEDTPDSQLDRKKLKINDIHNHSTVPGQTHIVAPLVPAGEDDEDWNPQE